MVSYQIIEKTDIFKHITEHADHFHKLLLCLK
jgi:hypothetical protein